MWSRISSKKAPKARAYLPSQRPSRGFYVALIVLPLAVFVGIVFAPI